MSSDFGFWKRGTGDPEEIFDAIAEGETENLDASEDVLRFREELLTRWPDLKNTLEPSDYYLTESPEDASKYVLLTLSVKQLDYWDEILTSAGKYGLVGYSGVAGEPI